MPEPTITALIIEDDKTQWPIYEGLLTPLGVSFHYASECDAGLKMAQEFDYAMIFMDLGLDRCACEASVSSLADGIACYERLARATSVPIIVASVFVGTWLGVGVFRKMQPFSVLEKPLKAREVEAVVAAVLAARGTRGVHTHG